MKTNNSNSTSDIIIVGAGIIGLSLANLCARNGFSVALLEREKAPSTAKLDSECQETSKCQETSESQEVSEQIYLTKSTTAIKKSPSDYDLRCFAISRASQKVFEHLDIWDNIIEPNAHAYTNMRVWDGSGFGEITFNAKEVSEENLGHIVEQRVIMQALWQLTRKQENISVIFDQSPKSIQYEENQVTIVLQDDQVLSANLVVGAEGAHSAIRKMVGIETKQESYNQTALIATLQTEHPHQNTAWQRFMPEGPIAFLPLSDPNVCSIVWTASPETIQQNLQFSKAQFCESVAKAFDYRLGKIIDCSERRAFPLSMLHASCFVKPRVVIVGDAAHVIHPLAGQGVNLGMQDVTTLCDVLLKAKQRDCDIGDILILRKYERSRKGPVNKMIHGMKFFKSLFGAESEAISIMRSFGLNVTNKIPFIKKKFIREAMGV